MPYVIVFLDPTKIEQPIVDRMKIWLQLNTAAALSDPRTLVDPNSEEDITIKPSEIFVRQHEVHPTDVNAAPVEIQIEAGKPKSTRGQAPHALMIL